MTDGFPTPTQVDSHALIQTRQACGSVADMRQQIEAQARQIEAQAHEIALLTRELQDYKTIDPFAALERYRHRLYHYQVKVHNALQFLVNMEPLPHEAARLGMAIKLLKEAQEVQ